jgi:UDP-glucose 4-epimerase
MRVFLTGATGFIGSHLLRRLRQEGADVLALVRPATDPWRIEPLLPACKLLPGELANVSQWAKSFREFRPQTVVHLAWAGVGNRHRNDAAQIDANLMPTVELARLSIEAGVEKFIGLGSQAEYGPLNRKISESDPTEPTTLYGAAKLAASVLVRQLFAQAGISNAWVRVFSTYGPMEDPDWMIPYLIGKLLAREKPALTACEQKWDYLYGPDAADALFELIRNKAGAGIFNLGSGQVYTLRAIVEKIRDMINPELSIGFGEVPYRPDQVMLLQADISRLQGATGWTPATSLEEGLRQTIEWHRSRAQGS